MGHESDDLRHLLDSLRRQASSERFFIVFEDLRREISESVVSGVIHEFDHPRHLHSKLVSTIVERGLRVFSILAWMHQEVKILSFIKHDCLDARLPMDEQQVSLIDGEVHHRFWKEIQWEYIPYRFVSGDFHRIVRDQVIIPFLSEQQWEEGSGGDLFKCTIPVPQQSFFPETVGTSLSWSRFALY